MNKDLYLSPSLVTFDTFNDLLGEVDDQIDAHKDAIAKYEDKLGVMLRGSGSEGKKGMTAFDQETTIGNAMDEEDSQNRRRRSSSEDGEEGWLVLETDDANLKVASGSTSSTRGKQTEALFKIIESLKARLVSLQKVRKLISELPGQGFNPNQKIVVMFRDGIPRQIIPSYEVSKAVKKFRYSEQFDIQVLS
jgi:hypothetical protein